MNPAAPPALPLPDPIPLPAPEGLFWFLQILTFFLHVVPMNLVLGGSIIAAMARHRGRAAGGDDHRALAAWLARIMPVAIAATITFGVAPLLFVQVLYGRLFFVSSILMAWSWLAVVPLLILGYYASYLLAFRGSSAGALAAPAAWGSALIFAVIAFIYSNNMSLMLRPETFAARHRADPSGFRMNLGDQTLPFRYLHFLIGAVAVAGLIVALYGLIRRKKDAGHGAWLIRHGVAWFSIPTGLNLVVGVIFLMSLPQAWLMRFLGGNVTATILLAAGILLGIATLVMVMRAAESPDPARPLQGGAAGLVLTLVVMILLRDQVRRAALDAASVESVRWVVPQWGVITVFAVLLLISLGTVAWMAVTLARGRARHTV